MSHELENGVCLQLLQATPNDDQIFNTPHTLQVLSVKKVGKQTDQDRYRVVISDGTHFIQGMLATQLNSLITDEVVQRYTIVCLERASCNYVQGKRLIILMGLRVIAQSEVKIGEPTAAEAASSNPPSAATTPAPQPPGQSSSSNSSLARQQPGPRNPPKGNWHPIEGLSPYQNNWTIKARVTQKSDLKTYSNQRGEGKLFNVTLMDDTGEIRGTGFNAVADQLYPKLEQGKVYFVSKAKVNLAKKKFSNVMNDYELSFGPTTEVEECFDNTDLPMIKYNFTTLKELQDLQKDSTCDVIAICKEVGDVTEFTSKNTNRTLKKRELTLVDQSGFSVRLTLWGTQAENFKHEEDSPVIAFKGVKVSDFNGRSLGMIATSTMTQNPDIPEAHTVRGWYDIQGSESTFQAHQNSGNFSGGTGGGFNRSELKPLLNLKVEANRIPEGDEKSLFFSTSATIMHIKADNIAYPACQTEGCNKKVVEDGGKWRCEKCNLQHDSPSYRYIISMAASDYTGQLWLQGFNDVGNIIFGQTADQLMELKDRDEPQYNVVLHRACYQTYNFLLRAKRDSFNDTSRIRHGISKVTSLNYKEECGTLLSLIDSPWGQQDLKSDSNAMEF